MRRQERTRLRLRRPRPLLWQLAPRSIVDAVIDIDVREKPESKAYIRLCEEVVLASEVVGPEPNGAPDCLVTLQLLDPLELVGREARRAFAIARVVISGVQSKEPSILE